MAQNNVLCRHYVQDRAKPCDFEWMLGDARLGSHFTVTAESKPSTRKDPLAEILAQLGACESEEALSCLLNPENLGSVLRAGERWYLTHIPPCHVLEQLAYTALTSYLPDLVHEMTAAVQWLFGGDLRGDGHLNFL